MMNLRQTSLLVALLLATSQLAAAPTGYSVNADAPLGDRLFAIDLATGNAEEKGPVVSLADARTDTEGLAFDANGTLWAVDENSMRLGPVSTLTGVIDHTQEVSIRGMSPPGNDFGLTFTCDGDLFTTSVHEQSLFKLDWETGVATRVGAPGSLGANISAIAAWGAPAKLYGLSNGLVSGGAPDTRSLYEIDPENGTAIRLGRIGPAASPYNQAGLGFDAEGVLWAITDRRNIAGQDFASEIFTVSLANGRGTLVETVQIGNSDGVGFEALAVSPPGGCMDDPAPRPPLQPLDSPSIPTLDRAGLLAAILALALTAFGALRRRS